MHSLPRTGFLANASPGLISVLERLSTEHALRRGEVLFRQGDTGDALFALTDGRLEISVLSGEGRKLVLDILRPGALFGEIALFDPGPRTATVTAIEPARLRRLKNADLQRAIRDTPALAIDMIQLAGQRMRWMNAQFGDQVFLTLPARLARRVLYLAEGGDGSLRMSQTQLADFVGATREAVSKTLRDWKAAGLVAPVRGGLRLLDRDGLEEIAARTES